MTNQVNLNPGSTVDDPSAAEGVAIVGISGRYPGAPDIATFWRNLRDGVESITFFSKEELLAAGVAPAMIEHPEFVGAKSIMRDAGMFDAAFFGYTPREAIAMDPQHRVFLECAWEALEDAGYAPQAGGDNPVGVFAGCSLNSYGVRNLATDVFQSLDGLEFTMSFDKDFLATRVSYKLNLKGPALVVQTACSASLAAVSQACQSLLNYQCDMALAGGASVKSPAVSGYVYKHGSIASRDGHCRTFDATASGTVNGEGVGVVALKRLSDAVADGDTIHAVIKGFAMNNDGSHKVGYTAPSVDGQAEVIAMAQAFAGIDAESVGYIEAHGTGTDLGDPIEVAALTQAFRATTQRKRFCGIGSVKTNVGHTDAAAGVTGLIKAALALEHREIPPSLHFEQPNPKIDFENSPFYVVDQLTPWPEGPTPRRAGVSSFGIGGTNVHVVLEEAPKAPASGPSRPWQLMVLSGRTPAAVDASVSRLSAHLQDHPGQSLADVAHTLRVGRRDFDHRAIAVCRNDRADAQAVLAGGAGASRKLHKGKVRGRELPVAFGFTGQGSQYPHMAAGLYQDEPLFRQTVDHCCRVLKERAGLDLMPLLYPAAGEDKAAAAERLRDTRNGQPALFVTEYAMAKLWMSWGVQPDVMIGHSLGEYVAACLAGVMELDDALALVAQRAALVASLPAGSMLAVHLPENEVQPLLSPSIALAAVNAPGLCVVSGETPAVDALEAQLRGRGMEPVRLHTSHAFHSHMLDPILGEFESVLRQVKFSAPKLRYVSNVTGEWITPEQATDPKYWVQQLRGAVRFSAGVQRVLEDESRLFLEVGPGAVLASLARQHLPAAVAQERVFTSIRPVKDESPDGAYLLETAGRLWMAGVAIDWQAFSQGEQRRRVPLPTYPFERQKYWLESGRDAAAVVANAAAPAPALPRKKTDVSDWFYVPSWKQTAAANQVVAESAAAGQSWLVFADEFGLGDKLADALLRQGDAVIRVRAGNAYKQQDDGNFVIDPAADEQYERVFKALQSRSGVPQRIVHAWGLTGETATSTPADRAALIDRCFWSPTCVARALGRLPGEAKTDVFLLSDGVFEILGNERLCPEKAVLLGPARVAPQEYPNVAFRSIDVVVPEAGNAQVRLIDQLVAEMRAPYAGFEPVAYRGTHRWVRTQEAVRVPAAPSEKPARLREQGVYLITGGLGGVGLALAEELAKSVKARLVLVGRSELPSASDWEQWLATHPEDDRISGKIRRLKAIKAAGAQLMIVAADVADAAQMQSAVSRARETFGAIHGVIHSAGVPAGGVIELKTRASAAAVLRAKVEGTRALEAALGNQPLDFMLLCSSLTATMGSAGQVDYAAANAFLDAYAQHRSHRSGLTVAVQWDAWAETGMAVDTEVPASLAEIRKQDLAQGIATAEGMDVFRRVLACSLPQVIVSTRELAPRLRPAVAVAPASGEPASLDAPTQAVPTQERSDALSADFVAPRNDAERAVAAIWQELFGIERMGIHDNFIEANGHSLLAIQIVARISKDLGVKLPVNALFEMPTIAEIAAEVERIRFQNAEEDAKLAEMLAMVEGLSDEEVNRLLNERL